MNIRDIPDNPTEFIDKCKQHNLKVTPQRTAIYNAIIAGKSHPSADDIYQKVREEFHNISFDTVNRTLITFAEIGIIDIVEGYGNPRRFDPNLKNHHHFYCIGCGKIEDFCNNEFDRIKIPIELEEKFTVLNKRVVLKGYCDLCRKKMENDD